MKAIRSHLLQDIEREMTGSLDDETLRNFHERLLYLRNLEDRKEAIKKNIEEQGKLTKELAKRRSKKPKNTGSSRGFISSIQTEETYQSYDRKRKKD